MDPREKKKKKILYIYMRERETERKRLILLVELRGLQGTNRGLRVLIPLSVNQLS